jgi:hypothetical protein
MFNSTKVEMSLFETHYKMGLWLIRYNLFAFVFVVFPYGVFLFCFGEAIIRNTSFINKCI